ncbi:MAG TPA: alcohol dehydrogenase AdhP [Methylomirabilota bacterium]|nr:alcohol dehydrogenase AdhP [Methylomirabilota bacterium]
MTDTMRAGVLERFGQPLRLHDVPVPVPGAGEVLVRVSASGVCHTDLHAATADWPVKPRLPVILGHEGVGRVTAVGPGVRSPRVGDRVGVPWLNSACGVCRYCLTGWETLCPLQKNTGYSVNGAHAEYVVAAAAYTIPVPDGLDDVHVAPIMCAGVTTYKGLKQTDARPGQWVLVVGAGGTGHMAVQYARAMGLRVAVVDVDDAKLAGATRLGAEVALSAAPAETLPGRVQRAIGGAHAALMTATSPRAVEQAVGCLRRGGTCVLVGIPPGTFTLSSFDLVVKGLTLRGSIVGGRQDVAEALAFAADGKVLPTVETRSLDEVNETMERLRRGQVTGRVVLKLA